MMGAAVWAISAEPTGVGRVCQSKPMRGIPMPPSFITMLGQAATALMPWRHWAITESSLPA